MPRYRLTIEYDGTGFVGWQRQPNGLSVQQAVEEAFSRFCGEKVTLFAAGRTDTGVHARAQTAHADLNRDWPEHKVMMALNYHLKPLPVCVRECRVTDEEFHARFSALRRHYLYRILNRAAPPVLERERVWHVAPELDVEAMNEAAAQLLGRHDFSSFRAAQCQAKSPVKTLDVLTVRRRGEEVLLYTAARSFMHNQVRAMTGTLVEIGRGRWPVACIGDILAARDRQAAGPNAPPWGLYFLGADYPGDPPRQPPF